MARLIRHLTALVSLGLRGDDARQGLLRAARDCTGMAALQAQLKGAVKSQQAADDANLSTIAGDMAAQLVSPTGSPWGA